MRIAFVDLYFSWPPHGGADVDAYHVLTGLHDAGLDVRLFVPSCPDVWERGSFRPEDLPFPATRLELTRREVNRHTLPRRVREAVDAFRPDGVILAHGFFLKPYVAEALSHYPTISRYYAYELTCPRNLRQYDDAGRCGRSLLENPDVCRRCALDAMKNDIIHWRLQPGSEEFVAARAYTAGYRDLVVRTLRSFRAVIASNTMHKRQMDPYNDDVRVIPGGTDLRRFRVTPLPNGPRKVILMTGRGEDPVKGMETLRAAGERLAQSRKDFEIWVTHSDYSLSNDWFKALGWQNPAGVAALYEQADICAAPALWEEPFGLVAVEAMAAARPVCASAAGGLRDTVVDGETGFLVPPGDPEELAEKLGRLLDNPDLRARMGAAGRRRAEAEYDWNRIIDRHYLPLLERFAR